jgi:hypothetical protein
MMPEERTTQLDALVAQRRKQIPLLFLRVQQLEGRRARLIARG